MANMVKPNPNLGVVVSELRRETFHEVDWQIAGWGDCTAQLGDAQQRAYEAVAQKHGYRDLAALEAAVAERTSHRWAYFHLPC